MTFQLNDRELKSKWLNNYKNEMSYHKEKHDYERRLKINEEQEYLEKLRREVEDEKQRILERKKKIMKDEMDRYYQHNVNKQKEEVKKVEEKLYQDNLSLNLGYEERVEKMKDYNNKLSEKIDQNMKGYLDYKSNINSNPHVRDTKEKYQDYINQTYKEKYEKRINEEPKSPINNLIHNDSDFLAKMSDLSQQQYKEVKF